MFTLRKGEERVYRNTCAIFTMFLLIQNYCKIKSWFLKPSCIFTVSHYLWNILPSLWKPLCLLLLLSLFQSPFQWLFLLVAFLTSLSFQFDFILGSSQGNLAIWTWKTQNALSLISTLHCGCTMLQCFPFKQLYSTALSNITIWRKPISENQK